MNCLECQEWLQRRLDGEALPALPALDEHLAGCPKCRRQHQAVPFLLEGLRLMPKPFANVDLQNRIVTRVLADRLARKEKWRRRVWTTIALAACLMLMALAGYLWSPRKDRITLAIHLKEKEPAAGLSLGQSVEEARRAFSSLTERLSDQSREQARLLLSAARLPQPLGLPESPLDTQSLAQTGRGVSEGIQTVAQSARRAVDYFFRELPPLEASFKN
jgi:predicted anti-sigma-YlaC factor YlaD